MSHTPTPWRIYQPDENDETYCVVFGPDRVVIPDSVEDGKHIIKAVNAYDETQALLEELSDYFDGKQDCEIDQDGYHPNAEMGFFLRIKEILEGTK